MCRPSGTRLVNLILPGTAVSGYRLSRRPVPAGLAASTEGHVCPKSEHAQGLLALDVILQTKMGVDSV
jgi:hypothetical protein